MVWNSLRPVLRLEPTDKEISTHGIIIAKIIEGKIAETWEEWDFAGFASQLNANKK